MCRHLRVEQQTLKWWREGGRLKVMDNCTLMCKKQRSKMQSEGRAVSVHGVESGRTASFGLRNCGHEERVLKAARTLGF